MTAREVVTPVVEIHCDGNGCKAKHRPPKGPARLSKPAARGSAMEAGWQTRPPWGKGSRSAPDLCPDCKARAEQAAAAAIDRFLDR